MKVFAVGTNMDEALLRRWVLSVRRLTIASLQGFALRWHKRSPEGAKLAAFRTEGPNDVIWGVVYELDDPGGKQVDEAQRAAGYRDERVTVVGADSAEHDCTVYVACAEMIDESMLPTRAYRDPIVNAARSNGLPTAYVDALARTPVVDAS